MFPVFICGIDIVAARSARSMAKQQIVAEIKGGAMVC
jgi:hypothetical protein